MKDSARYARKVKRLLSGAKAPERPERPDSIRLLVQAVLEEDCPPKTAGDAIAAIQEEFVDFNELRVSPVKDVVECLGRDFPGARAKAETLSRALNVIFERANTLSLEYLADRPRRDIRKALREELGLSPYAESVLTLHVFGGHAVPVDALLLESLRLGGQIHPSSDLADLQGFLERIILSKDGAAAHEGLRAYAWRMLGRAGGELARRMRQAEAARVRAEAASAKAEAQAAPRPGEQVPVAAGAEASSAQAPRAAPGAAAPAAAPGPGKPPAGAAKAPQAPRVKPPRPAQVGKGKRPDKPPPKAVPKRAKK